MTLFEIIALVICILWIISVPFLLRFKVFQFCTLMITPFILSYLIFESITRNGTLVQSSSWLFLFLFIGLIYQAKRFWDRYLKDINS